MLASLAIVLFCFVLIRPQRAARLIATALFLAFGTTALLVYGFHPKSEFLHHKSKIARYGSERTKRIARRVIRCLTIIWTAFILIVWTFPVMRDFVDIVIHSRSHLVEVTGRVRSNEFTFGLYFVNQDLLVLKQGETSGRDYEATFFPPFGASWQEVHVSCSAEKWNGTGLEKRRMINEDHTPTVAPEFPMNVGCWDT